MNDKTINRKKIILKIIYLGVIVSIAFSILFVSIIGLASSKNVQQPDYGGADNKRVNESPQGKILDVTPEYLFFGAANVRATTSPQVFKIRNIGTESFNVNEFFLNTEQFSLVNPRSTPFNLAPGDSDSVMVRFNPLQLGFIRRSFFIINDSENDDDKEVFLGGIGGDTLLNVIPHSWNYGIVSVETDSDMVFQLKNESEFNIEVDDLSIKKSGSDFTLLNYPNTPFELSANSSEEVTVRFHPTSSVPNVDFFRIDFSVGTFENYFFEVFLKGIGGIKTLEVEPGEFNFDEVTVGKDSVTEFLLINNGNQDFKIDSITVGQEEFLLLKQPQTPFTLTPGDTDSVSVSFSPDSIGSKIDTLKIENNSDNASPVKNIPLQGFGVGKILSVEPDSICDFGTILIGEYSDTLFVLRNDGNQKLEVEAISIQIINAEPGEFKLLEDPDIEFGLDPEETRTIEVRFEPSIPGPKEGVLKIQNDSDNKSPIKEITLLGNSGGKILTVDPDSSFDFGSVSVSDDSNKVFILKNEGDTSLQVTNLTIEMTAGEEGEFELVNPPDTEFTIAPGGTKQVNVRFDPFTPGDKKGIFKIENNSDNAPSKVIELKGKGTAKLLIAEPDTLNFDTIPVGNDSALVIELSNEGNQDLDVTDLSIEITQGEQGEFSLLAAPNLPFTLTPGSSQNIEVNFSPSSKGLKEGILNIENNSENAGPILPVHLIGNSLDALILSFINYPNPFGDETFIKYDLSQISKVSINIYDIAGDLVVELANDEQKEWANQRGNIRWDGKDFNEHKLANGVYICELIAVTDDGREERRYRKIAIFSDNK